MLAAIFTTFTVPPSESRERVKRHHSSRTNEGEDACGRKKERTYLEASRRDLLLDEAARQMRARELVVGESISRVEVVEMSTTYGADTFVDTTKGVPKKGAGLGKSDLPAC